jgi:hypothetical protein
MSHPVQTSHQSHQVQQDQSLRVSFTLLDDNDMPIPASSLLTATLTLTDLETGRTINSRLLQDVLNANNVTITEEGRVTWEMQGNADNVLVRSNQQLETHRGRFAFTWGNGGQFTHDVYLLVRKLGS